MGTAHLHPWPASLQEARDLQKELSGLVRLERRIPAIRTLAAADVAYARQGNWAWAGALLFRFPELEVLEERYLRLQVEFPYVPGFLSFREGPGLIKALSLLPQEPDLILCDGQGIAHARGLGLASHVGVLLGKPTIGCAKSRLIGEFERSQLGKEKGSWVPLIHEGRTIGAAVRTRSSVKPLFISPGHLIGLPSCIKIVLACCCRFRIPEPLRQAHLRVERRKREDRDPLIPSRPSRSWPRCPPGRRSD